MSDTRLPEGILPSAVPEGKHMLIVEFGPTSDSYEYFRSRLGELEAELVDEEAFGVWDDYAGATATAFAIRRLREEYPQHTEQLERERVVVTNDLGATMLTSGQQDQPRVYFI